jgi:hypothetical protein
VFVAAFSCVSGDSRAEALTVSSSVAEHRVFHTVVEELIWVYLLVAFSEHISVQDLVALVTRPNCSH